MAKAKIDLKKMSKALRKRFDDFLNSPEERKKTSRIIKNELIVNLRSGLGSNDKPLPELSKSWKSKRGELSAFNKTVSQYRQNKSNVTFTGKFLRGLKVITDKAGFFSIFYSGERPAYKQSNEHTAIRSVNNSKIFSGLTSKGWKLAGVTKNARIRITKQFRRFIRRRKR